MDYRKNYQEWLENVSAHHKAELVALADNDKELQERFTIPLAFGTAGMRGTIALGISNMNEYTVARATQGLAAYIATLGAVAKARGVVVSYDTRNMSFEFALETAKVLSANDIKVYLFENVRPVPLCSFAVRELNCVAGVMITASHNPKEYNGYKVYGEDGAQMSPEATAIIVQFIEKISYFGVKKASLNVSEQKQIAHADNLNLDKNITVIGASLDEKYYSALDKLALSSDAVKKVGKDIKIVYTPLHGSGYVPVTAMLARMNIAVNVVEEQRLPDGNFPTVAVPNPEQPDALSLGIALANKLGSDIVIGTDPDCDRMGVAIRDDKNEFVLLNGNQIGSMLMDYVLMRNTQNGTMPTNPAVVKTIVTTKFANEIAKKYNTTVFDVLTGFKFIGEKIKEWEENGKYTFMFGFEESYGYLCGTHARDKDAVVSAMLFAEMACYYTDHKITLFDKLQQLFDENGYFVETSKSFTFKGLDGMDKMSEIMRKFCDGNLVDIAGCKVASKINLNLGVETFADGHQEKVDLPATNVIKYTLNAKEWVCVRPSGTEPKIKIYVSVCADSMANAKEKSARLIAALEKLI
ncbi:MAG: phospho-sugar mutase [Clostridia bacterium]